MVTLNLQLFNNNKLLGDDMRNDEREVQMSQGIYLYDNIMYGKFRRVAHPDPRLPRFSA